MTLLRLTSLLLNNVQASRTIEKRKKRIWTRSRGQLGHVGEDLVPRRIWIDKRIIEILGPRKGFDLRLVYVDAFALQFITRSTRKRSTLTWRWKRTGDNKMFMSWRCDRLAINIYLRSTFAHVDRTRLRKPPRHKHKRCAQGQVTRERQSKVI